MLRSSTRLRQCVTFATHTREQRRRAGSPFEEVPGPRPSQHALELGSTTRPACARPRDASMRRPQAPRHRPLFRRWSCASCHDATLLALRHTDDRPNKVLPSVRSINRACMQDAREDGYDLEGHLWRSWTLFHMTDEELTGSIIMMPTRRPRRRPGRPRSLLHFAACHVDESMMAMAAARPRLGSPAGVL
jgi:hypothetical protein